MKKSLENNFEFQNQTQLAIGQDALDHIMKFLTMQGLSQPLWLFQKLPAHNIAIPKILKKTFAELPTVVETVSPSISDTELLSLATHLSSEPFDCLIVAGNADLIDNAKIITLLATYKDQTTVAEMVTSSLVKKKLQPLPLVVIPFGEYDGNECQSRFTYQKEVIESTCSAPALAIFDGRLTARTSTKALASTMCTSLLQVFTALHVFKNSILTAAAESALYYAHQTLEALISTTRSRRRWTDLTLSAAATLHAAGVCAQNRGESTFITFTEALAIPNLANKHQTAVAILPYVLSLIEETTPQLYDDIKRMLSDMDPKEFVHAWETLLEPGISVPTIRKLCAESHHFLALGNNLLEMEPILSRMDTQRGAL